MRKIGSQTRVTIEEAEMFLAWVNMDGSVVLDDGDGNLELWTPNDDYAGYVIDIDGRGYEFVREWRSSER